MTSGCSLRASGSIITNLPKAFVSTKVKISVGNGVWKSTDGGDSWHFIGLADVGQIGSIEVDPRDADTVFAAALGHPFGPNPERGVFRSRDGGATWEHRGLAETHTIARIVVHPAALMSAKRDRRLNSAIPLSLLPFSRSS